jgi:WD40 repeat protein
VENCRLSILTHLQVNACSWSPDGTKVVSCSNDKTMRVWDVSRGECINTLTGHDDEVSLHIDGSVVQIRHFECISNS